MLPPAMHTLLLIAINLTIHYYLKYILVLVVTNVHTKQIIPLSA